MDIVQGKTTATLAALAYQPGLGLVLRVTADLSGIDEFADELGSLLHASPFVLWRACCDSTPTSEEEHIEGCKKKGKAK